MKKKTITRFAVLACLAACLAACLVGVRAENLISNGDFSGDALDAMATVSGSAVNQSVAFKGWRLFTVDALGGTSLTGTIVATPTGNQAMRLDFKCPDGTMPVNWGVDRELFPAPRIPVTPGVEYEVSFEAAHVGGSTGLQVIVPEYWDDREFHGGQTAQEFAVTEPGFQKFSFSWTPRQPGTTEIGLQFKPFIEAGDTDVSLMIDNVQITPSAQPESH